MSEERTDELTRLLREEYNAPPEAPRDEMWSAIQARLEARESGVVSLDQARSRRAARLRAPLAWAAAAAAVLVLGVGIGRMTAPTAPPVAEAPAGATGGADPGILRLAAVEHLGRTEALLRMVRADGASGWVDPAVGTWARSLLTETRLLMDARQEQDPAMEELLEDLELVLVQIVGVTEAAGGDQGRAREELILTLDGMERREVLSRIQAVVPPGAGLAGT
ncbi:MAG TPA: hypothetical protein VLH75_18675 [Longimicrobiales bacterium]|nr:hypothetical protein [Longimicrobiales bacterium]